MDLIEQIRQWWLKNKQQAEMFPNEEHPNYASYQERFSRTPGVVVPQTNLPEGVAAQYLPKDNLILSTSTTGSNTISHEAAHSIYDKAGLEKYISNLNEQVPHYIRTIIGTNPIYQQMTKSYPETLSTEGLGFAMNSPGEDDEKYVNYAASKIADPVLKNRLLMLFQHAKQMSILKDQNGTK